MDENEKNRLFKVNQPTNLTTISFSSCPLCKFEHYQLEVTKLTEKVDTFTHKVKCPFTQDEFYITFLTS